MKRLSLYYQYVLLLLLSYSLTSCAQITTALGPGFWAWLIIGAIIIGAIVMFTKAIR